MSALSMPKDGRINAVLLGLAIIAMVMVLGASAAFAGTDTTFNTALTKFTDFLEGSGGKIITVMSLAGGIVALASGRFSLGQVAVPVAVGVGAGTGIPIVTSTVTATI
jgi:conjugal transfer pilus assembly protein TraA